MVQDDNLSVVLAVTYYCNSLFYGTTEQNLDHLQRLQNTLARVVCRASWSANDPDLLQELHWLPVRRRVRFMLAATTFTLVCRLSFTRTYTRLRTYKNAAVFHYTPASTTTSTHFSCISCLHRHCTYCVELTFCKHSIC